MDKLLRIYLDKTINEDYLPSKEDFTVWLLEDNELTYTEAHKLAGGSGGIINTYGARFLKRKGSEGGRNAFVYVQLLKELLDQDAIEVEDRVVITINKKGKNRLLDE